MATSVYEIGKKEKHIVEASYSPITGILKIKLDGKQIQSKMIMGTGTLSFIVGQNEKHRVDIKASGVVAAKLDMFLDGVHWSLSKEPLKASRVALYVATAIIACLAGYFGMKWLLG